MNFLLPFLSLITWSSLAIGATEGRPSHHFVGWTNLFLPGGGQLILGNPGVASQQFVAEIGAFAWGYSLSKQNGLSLDGAQAELPTFNKKRRLDTIDYDSEIAGDLLQEFGIKYHMVNVYNSYREAAGPDSGLDSRPTIEYFKDPFRKANLTDPWVYIPLTFMATATIIEYYASRPEIPAKQRIKPSSNFLYSTNYLFAQPIGSGAPEELFYRGFLQTEAQQALHSPVLGIALSTAAFALSHRSGPGRISAAITGSYLGYLAYRNAGKLGPAITLHFWSGLLLGLQSVLLSHEAQRTTPPGAFAIQINY